jgi:hypothetical protein
MDNTEIIRIVAGVMVLLFLIPFCLYFMTLSRALGKCSPESRTMQPGMVWLALIPFFGFIWNFFVVLALAKSLDNEFRTRGITDTEPELGKTIGLAMSVCMACGVIPLLGGLISIVALVLWVMYWIKIAGFSKRLDESPTLTGLPVYTQIG